MSHTALNAAPRPGDLAALRILAHDHDSRTLLLGGGGQGMSAFLFHTTPLLIALQLVLLVWAEESLWFLDGTYPLLLAVWTLFWLLLVVYSGGWGLYHHAYLFSPERQRLWHLNSGQLLATDAPAPLPVSAEGKRSPLQEAGTRLNVAPEVLRERDWSTWAQLPCFQPPSLAGWYRQLWARRNDWLWLLIVIEVLLFCSLFTGLVGFLLSHLLVYSVGMLWDLGSYWLHRQQAARARAALAELSVEDVMGQEA